MLRLPKDYLILIAIPLAILGVQKTLAVPVRIDNSQIGQQLNLPIYEWVDKSKPRKGTIIAVHGLTLYAACWNNFALHLASKGFRVFALDQRGFGRWLTDGSKYGGNEKIEIGQSEQDLLDLATSLRQLYPNQKQFFLGESLGSNMTLMLISDHPELADGAVLAALCYKNRIHPKPAYWVKDFAKEVVKPNAPLNLTPYSAPYLTNDPTVAKACNTDPLINRKMTPAELVKVDVLNDKAISAAKHLTPDFPTLLVSGSKDAMFKSVDLAGLVPKLGSKNVSLHLIMGKGHLLLEHQKADPQITSLIDDWLNKQTSNSLVTNLKKH
jgi:alpha-beta hydrolase superfamily lysophospholipase